MAHIVRVTVEEIIDSKIVESHRIVEKTIEQVSNIGDLGFTHQQQIDILQQSQDGLLQAQSCYLQETLISCPTCSGKLHSTGNTKSILHSVLTDHKVATKRQRCSVCGWTSVPSIRSLFGTDVHPDLAKLQCEASCDTTYRQAQKELDRYSYHPRTVNNHEHLYRTVGKVGNYIAEHSNKTLPEKTSPAKKLICQVDGGHLKSKDKSKRSFEAITSVVYSPTNIVYPDVKHHKATTDPAPPRGIIHSKHCAASALSDDGELINEQTLLAAKKQGLNKNTQLTALCDGADNCWNVIAYLENHCAKVTCILDWFHIAMKFENISLPQYHEKELKHIKWCLWHYKIEDALSRLETLSKKAQRKTMKERLVKLLYYLTNNRERLCHYAERYKNKEVISSSLAESTVETLINQRCKGKQHMKWTREGAHALLQLRASRASNDWVQNGRHYILNALTKKVA